MKKLEFEEKVSCEEFWLKMNEVMRTIPGIEDSAISAEINQLKHREKSMREYMEGMGLGKEIRLKKRF